MYAILKKELSTYFDTPFAYIFIGIYLVLSGIMFTLFNLVGGSSQLSGMFGLMKNFAIIIFPILTMKIFAEERVNGTENFLLTSKIGVRNYVLGKFFATCILFAISLCATGVYIIIIAVYGVLDVPAVVVAYLGFFLLGVSMIAISTFISSFAENQITAAIASFGVLFVLVMLLSFTKTISIPVITPALSALAITKYYDDFTLGVVPLGTVMYYLGISWVCLLMTIKNIEYRRYR